MKELTRDVLPTLLAPMTSTLQVGMVCLLLRLHQLSLMVTVCINHGQLSEMH